MAQVTLQETLTSQLPLPYVVQGGDNSIQFEVVGSAFAGVTVQFQASNDGINWVAIQAYLLGAGTQSNVGLPVNNISTAWVCQAIFAQYRLYPIGLASGSYTARMTGLTQQLSSLTTGSASAAVVAGATLLPATLGVPDLYVTPMGQLAVPITDFERGVVFGDPQARRAWERIEALLETLVLLTAQLKDPGPMAVPPLVSRLPSPATLY